MSEGSAGAPVSLDDRYALERGRVLLSGVQALVRLPMMQRRRDAAAGLDTAGFVSGYRGSPLAGLDREMQRARRHLEGHRIVFRPGVNEDLAATAVWGTQQLAMSPGARHDGVFAMWYGKGPGVDRSLDAIRHANAVGTTRHGGVLLLTGDDHGAVSSTLPHQSEHNLISAMVPMLAAGGVGEYLDYGLLGWAMSRASGLWVGFKCQTDIVECTASVDVDPGRLVIHTPELDLPPDGLGPRWPDGPQAMERRLLRHKLRAATAFARANRIDRVVGPTGPARLGIVAAGKSWLDLTAALRLLGIDAARAAALGIRLYKIGLVWPLEPEGLGEFADGLEEILVVEEKRPVVEDQIKAILFNRAARQRLRVSGKSDPSGAPLLPEDGELDPARVARAVAARIAGQDAALRDAVARLDAIERRQPTPPAGLPAREAYYCAGCPHSVSTHVPAGSRASTGIGCHMMAVGMDRDTATFTQMGGEGVSWTGMAPFTDEPHIFVNMGDGTYFHSGILAVRAAVGAGVNATYKILYNDAVAMTGGQPVDGQMSVPMVASQLLAEGVVRVAVVSERPELLAGALPAAAELHPRDDLDAVQKRLREVKGVTAIVFDQVCAAEKRRRRKRGAYPQPAGRAVINELVCEGCGDCSAVSNCIAVAPLETPFGRKRRIDQSSCNADLSCVKGFCPSFVTVEGGTPRAPRRDGAAPAPADPPDPAPQPLTRAWNIFLAGIGGTGVVTTSQILAMAAHLDGRAVLCLDQTGIAQKNGAVVSHLRIAPDRADLDAVRIGAGQTDLLLGFDMVVAASTRALATLARDRSRAVVDDAVAPTAGFLRDGAIDFRAAAMRRAIGDAAAGADFLPATALATERLGDAIAGNMVLLGAAWQKGLVPVSRAAIERAIELNGVAAAANRAAFAWGRALAAGRAAAPPPETPPPETLDATIERRAEFLAGYQDAAYAARYRALVARARAAEGARLPGREDFAMAVARNAFRLMAYKDEYEVARLHRDPGFAARLDALFAGPYRLRYHLSPPFVRRRDPRTGAPAKLAFGSWMRHVFRPLAALKFLRGTPFDPFGMTADRRLERRLLAEYLADIDALCAALDARTHPVAVAIAALPERIRGFGHVKRAAAEAAGRERADLLARLAAARDAGDVRTGGSAAPAPSR
jgi:indolepyruvate ferredoxin oxidoreductase